MIIALGVIATPTSTPTQARRFGSWGAGLYGLTHRWQATQEPSLLVFLWQGIFCLLLQQHEDCGTSSITRKEGLAAVLTLAGVLGALVDFADGDGWGHLAFALVRL